MTQPPPQKAKRFRPNVNAAAAAAVSSAVDVAPAAVAPAASAERVVASSAAGAGARRGGRSEGGRRGRGRSLPAVIFEHDLYSDRAGAGTSALGEIKNEPFSSISPCDRGPPSMTVEQSFAAFVSSQPASRNLPITLPFTSVDAFTAVTAVKSETDRCDAARSPSPPSISPSPARRPSQRVPSALATPPGRSRSAVVMLPEARKALAAEIASKKAANLDGFVYGRNAADSHEVQEDVLHLLQFPRYFPCPTGTAADLPNVAALTSLPAGFLGKLRLRKSGKAQLEVGGALFELASVAGASYASLLVALQRQKRAGASSPESAADVSFDVYEAGPVDRKIIVTPVIASAK